MIHTDARFAEAVETAVTRLETLTDAELVVVAAPRSGSYRDVVAISAGVVSFVFLLLAVYSPWAFSPLWLPLDLAVVGGLTAWVVARAPGLTRRLVSARRRKAQVDDAAAAAFVQEQVHGTRNRTGVLIYVSALEAEVRVLPDHGLDGRVPRGEWNRIRWHATALDPFLKGLEQVGDVLARHVPPVEGDNPDEIPNAPRVRE
ncbi:MAG: hypothetical protein H6739_34370 [Alphaproteobacteria bacterium]|nr:hypothetical protein [Alphaproteobacteria bacterium]